MNTEKLDRTEWKAYFDGVTKQVEGKQALIEIASLALGDQIQAEWCPLFGLSYDPKDDPIEIALQGLDHLIRNPTGRRRSNTATRPTSSICSRAC